MAWDGDIMIIRANQRDVKQQGGPISAKQSLCLLAMAGNFHSMKWTEFYSMGFIVIRVPNKYKTNSPCSLASGLSLSVMVIKPFLLSFSFAVVKTEKTPSHMHITLPDKCHKTWKHWIVPSKDASRKLHFTWSLCQNNVVCFVKVCPFHGCCYSFLHVWPDHNIMFSLVNLSCLISGNIWWFI